MYTLPTLTPSLSNTPTTVSSSFDGSWEKRDLTDGPDYDFNTRPLQSRSNPLYAMSPGKNVDDLVTPFVPPKAMGIAQTGDLGAGPAGEDFWGKKVVVRGMVAREQGLGELVRKDVL